MGTTAMNAKVSNEISVEKKPKVTIILGGPGSGKGTQCARISKEFGCTHLASGEILHKESRSGSDKAVMIGKMLKEGSLVPPDVTDNVETIRKRFKIFLESSLPVIEHYNSKGKVQKAVDEEVFEAIKAVFTTKGEKKLQEKT